MRARTSWRRRYLWDGGGEGATSPAMGLVGLVVVGQPWSRVCVPR